MNAALLVAHEALCPEPDALAARWRALAARSEASFFLSWTWIGSWLRATGARPTLLSLSTPDGEEVGLALFGEGRERRKFGRQRVLRLNEAADEAADRAFMEFNAPLAASGHEDAVMAAIAAWLDGRRDWRVLRLSGVAPDCPLVGILRARRRILAELSPAYAVELARVRAAGGDYLSLLSANTRGHIRRSIREHGGGEPLVERAGDADELADWLGEMVRLNLGRHADNAWDQPLFRAFVAKIAIAGLMDGSVDLLRISWGGVPTGYLLNFVHGRRAMNYQSAFAAPANAKVKPGLMSHAAAVRHYAGRDLALYSLLAGKDRYKQSLSTSEELLHWWQLERFAPGLEIEYWLRRLFRR